MVADLAVLLARQCGILTRAQALGAGCTDSRIRAHLRAGRWQRVHHRVYCATTGALSRLQQLWAALLYAGRGAVLSHETAAELHELAGTSLAIHVTVPTARTPRGTVDVVIHRSDQLHAEAVNPVLLPLRTRVERTVLDLIDRAPTIELAFAWLAVGCQRRRTTPPRLGAAMSRRPGLRWSRELRPALADIATGSSTVLEWRYLQLSRRHALPLPGRQVRLVHGRATRWLDRDYHPVPLRAELDGRLGHDQLIERWRDMDRDNAAAVAGISVLRYGWADVVGRPCQVAAQTAAMLDLRGWTGARARACGPACRLDSSLPTR